MTRISLLSGLWGLLPLIAGGCATTGATFQSGVGDAMLAHPPYAAGSSAESIASMAPSLGYLPVSFQRGAAQAALFDPPDGPGSAVAQLLSDMNAYLDSTYGGDGRMRRLGAKVEAAAVGTPPDVRFGCRTATGMPGDECAERGDSVLGRDGQTMLLTVGRPSNEWIAWLADRANEKQVDAVLVLSLEVGQYLPRQVGLRGDKVVELGTSHTVRLPWLTSLETPVPVLQVTGALVRPDGRAIRIGAEGILARGTPLLASGGGAQALLTTDDVALARVQVRTDLPGQPLAWRVALENLLREVGAGKGG